MMPAPNLDRPQLRSWSALLRRHALLIATIILLVVLGIQTLLRSEAEWQNVYIRAARHWMAGQDMYRLAPSYAYPPFMAMLAAPLAAAPEWLSRLTWFAGSAVGLVVMVTAAWQLANGVPLDRLATVNRRESYAFACGLAIALGFILNAFAHQQTDVLIGALLLAGALSLRKGRDAGGGTLIGLAAACKASPLLWFPYLLWRGRWTAGVLVVVVAVAANLVPDAIVRPPRGGWWIEAWIEDFIRPTQRLDAPLGVWASAIEQNQSLNGTVQRLINTKLLTSPPSPTVVVRPLVDTVALKIILYALFVLLIVASVVAATRARRRMPFAAGFTDRDSYEFSIVLILALILSPMSSRPHFGTLILPAFCLARLAFATGDQVISFVVAAAVVLVGPPYRYLVPAKIHAALLWGGATTAAALLLWLGCVIVLWRDRNCQPACLLSAANST
jgi:alpha-1,2-mannosyltransferase